MLLKKKDGVIIRRKDDHKYRRDGFLITGIKKYKSNLNKCRLDYHHRADKENIYFVEYISFEEVEDLGKLKDDMVLFFKDKMNESISAYNSKIDREIEDFIDEMYQKKEKHLNKNLKIIELSLKRFGVE